MCYVIELETQKKNLRYEIDQLSDWLLNNTRSDDFFDKNSRRNELLIRIEVINQKLQGRWKKITIQDAYNISKLQLNKK